MDACSLLPRSKLQQEGPLSTAGEENGPAYREPLPQAGLQRPLNRKGHLPVYRPRLPDDPGHGRSPSIFSGPILRYGALAADTGIRIRTAEARITSSARRKGQEPRCGRCKMLMSPPAGRRVMIKQREFFMSGGGQGEPCLTDAAPRGRLRHAVRG